MAKAFNLTVFHKLTGNSKNIYKDLPGFFLLFAAIFECFDKCALPIKLKTIAFRVHLDIKLAAQKSFSNLSYIRKQKAVFLYL